MHFQTNTPHFIILLYQWKTKPRNRRNHHVVSLVCTVMEKSTLTSGA